MTEPGAEDSAATRDFRQARPPDHLRALVERLELQGQQIDALQVEAARKGRPWWREPATIIAAVALVASGVFSALSRVDLTNADDQAKREKLTTLVQKLTAIQREFLSAQRDHFKTPVTTTSSGPADAYSLPVPTATPSPGASRDPVENAYYESLGSVLNTDRVMLARQAANLAESIPDLVTSVEFYAVADQLASSGETTRALKMLDRAEKNAVNVLEFTAAVRERALILFNTGHADAGREQMKRALDVFEQQPRFKQENNLSQQAAVKVDTEVKFAMLEFGARDCKRATAHLDAADKQLRGLADLQRAAAYRDQVAELRKRAESCPP